MWQDWLWIVAGLVTLIFGAELLVRGSVWIALSLGMSKMMVGLTLVAFGTSAPELVVSVEGALAGDHGFATGTVLGSNIANLGLIVGSAALIAPIKMPPRLRFELMFTIAAGGLALLPFVSGTRIDRWYGAVLVAFIVCFTWLLIRRHRRSSRVSRLGHDDGPDPTAQHGATQILLHVGVIGAGVAGLYYGGNWLVNGANEVASGLGMDDTLISLTVIAIGTSLPELVTSIVAARKGHPELALGNVLGSNIFNVGMVLGVTALIEPLPATWDKGGTAATVGLVMAIYLAVSISVKQGIRRGTGAILITAYAAYLTTAIAAR